MTVTIHNGDCRDVLRTLPDESVHCAVTSPPYWGLRDYGIGKDAFGLEPTYQLYVEHAVAIFREVWRVLRKDGTLWLNLGDSYTTGASTASRSSDPKAVADLSQGLKRIGTPPGLKSKDLVGIPWRVAFALQADGWYLRQDIIWSKPNPMPESVRDRCTKAHEYLFLLSKSERYYFDADAIAEPASYDPSDTKFPDGWDTGPGGHGAFHRQGREKGRRSDAPESWKGSVFDGERDLAVRPDTGRKRSGNKERKPVSARGVPIDTGGKSAGAVAGSVPWEGTTRNKRSVWTVGTAPFSEAHFATFPPALIEPCIKAGVPIGGTVLDPFGGAGTTGLVADRLQRNAILIELNPEYAAMARRRIDGDAPLFAQAAE